MSKLLARILISPDREGTIFTPVGVRVSGLVHITQGLVFLIGGHRAQKSRKKNGQYRFGWTLAYSFWGAFQSSRMKREKNPPPPPKPEPEYCKATYTALVSGSQFKPNDTDLTCELEKGHDGAHESYLGGDFQWIGPDR